ncbi:MAG: hypothetical protein LBU64_03070 [Planctomycetota bacterium]|nr:hypothetical protein [Planctomycetota bacterium]
MTSEPGDEPREVFPSARLEAKRARGRRRYLWAALLILAAVAAGGVLGSAATIIYLRGKGFPRPPPPDSIARAMLERLEAAVAVSGEEKRAVERIALSHLEKIADIHAESFAGIRKEFESLHAEVGEVLGPERFRVWDDRERERWRKLREQAGFRKRGEGGARGKEGRP